MRRFFYSLLLCGSILIGSITPHCALAAERAGDDGKLNVNKNEILSELKKGDYKNEVTFTVNEGVSDDTNIPESLRFDSVEEAVSFFENLSSIVNSEENRLFLLDTNELNLANIVEPNGKSRYINTTVSWWGGGNTSLLSMTNADVSFYYTDSNGGTISNIRVNNSYMTGIYGATWQHKSGSAVILDSMRVQFSVTGIWTIGIAIKGLPINGSFEETITSQPPIDMRKYCYNEK